MKCLAALVLCSAILKVAVSLDSVKSDLLWEKWKETFNKTYLSSSEGNTRKENFLATLQLVEENNEAYQKGEETYRQAIYSFADLTHEEFIAKRGGLSFKKDSPIMKPKGQKKIKSNSTVSDENRTGGGGGGDFEYSWKTLGKVSPVKDQGDCGSCWAFAMTGALESQLAINKEIQADLSEQQLIDCDCDNYGCDGGDPFWSLYTYSKDIGLTSEWMYPYKEERQYCKQLRTLATYKNYDITYPYLDGDEDVLKRLVKEQGPALVAIYATQKFANYQSGIFKDNGCANKNPNHAVLVVGYGQENNKDYWLVKNSWGSWWGESGYIRMRRNQNNMCGIADYGAVPILWTSHEHHHHDDK